MTRGSPAIVIAAVFAVSAWSVRGVAQSDAMLSDSYVAIKPTLGLGGTLSVHNDRYLLTEMDEEPSRDVPAMSSESDLNASFGGQVEYVFGLHRYFALAGLLGARAWRSAAGAASNESMSLGFDVGVAPQVRLPVSGRLEFYVSVPLALTLSILNESRAWTDDKHMELGRSLAVAQTYGYGLGVLAGARFSIARHFGLLAELGYQRFAFSHEVQFKVLESLDAMGLGTPMSVDFASQQVRLAVGLFF